MERGSVFAGYTILRELGRGGMGTVYLAQHPRLPRTVALKLLARDHVVDRESLRRFEREAELIAALDHPGIVTVFDRGSVDGQPWISMRYVEGTDASKLRAHDLPLRRAAHIIAEIADALDYAHSMGVLHRDIKPANILLTTWDGTVENALLSDFGIARAGSGSTHLTATGTINATLAYASPEQLVGSPLDGRTDQYSLACTLFRLLTGRTPFEASDPVTTITGHLHLAPPAPSTCRPDLPQALDAVISRALAKRPEERFPSCADFAAAVAATAVVSSTRSAAHTPIEARPQAAVSTDRVDSPRSSARGPGRTVRLRRWQIALAIAVVVVLGIGSGFGLVDLLDAGSRADAASPTTTTRPATTTQPVTPSDTAEAQRASDLLRATFPRMIPADTNSTAGYLGTSCTSHSKVIVPKAVTIPGIDFGNWVSVWRCLSGTGMKCCAYFLLAYRTPADVQGVVDKLPANTEYADSVAGLSVTNYRFFRPESTVRDSETGNLVTTFPGDPVRGAMLMYALPGFMNSPANRNERAETMDSWLRGAPLT